MATDLHIDELPPELIFNIFSFLDRSAPSETRLHDQPSLSMLSNPDSQSLKSVSLVNRRWRVIALPFLFRHVVWAVDCWNLISRDDEARGSSNKSDLPMLESFIKDNNLSRYVESVTLCVTDNLFRNFWHNDPPTSSSSNSDGLDDFRTLSVEDARTRADGISMWKRRSQKKEDWNWLWELLFDTMNPNRFTMIGLPRVIAYLISTEFYTSDAWHFKDQINILSLEIGKPIDSSVDPRAKRTLNASTPAEYLYGSVAASAQNPNPSQDNGSRLFTIRPWRALLLNEGSSIHAYRSYEFYHRRPPSILESLLGCRREVSGDKPLIPPSIRSLSYVAIFPLSSHFNSLITHLPPTLDRLFMQIVPRNGILEDQRGMERIQPSDLWMERNTCYSLVMRQLFEGTLDVGSDDDESEEPRETGWRNLVIFESGDAADREAWEMAVEYVRMSGTPWSVEADGVLVRHPDQARWRPVAGLDAAENAGSDDQAMSSELQVTDEGFELL